jgi:hypothetical protein
MSGEDRQEARDTLASRLMRLTAKSLGDYINDNDAEIRAAAILASASKEWKDDSGPKLVIPLIIAHLDDRDPYVARAAHTALKAMTKQDFGPAADASREDHEKAVAAWKEWWKTNGGK